VTIGSLVLAVGIAALVSWRQPGLTAPPSPPGTSTPSPGVVLAAATSASADPIDESAPPPRCLVSGALAAASSEGASAAAAVLEVTVESVGRDAPHSDRTRVPFVEVGLQTRNGMQLARTDERGMAAFEVAHGDGSRVEVFCGLGAEAAVTLSSSQPTRLVLMVQPRVVVTGKVVDATGRGIADATLVMLPWQGFANDSPAPWRIGRSDADGSFAIGLAIGGMVGAHHRVHGPSAMHLVRPGTAGAPLPIATLELRLLALSAQVSGVVRDHEGQPVADAELEFQSREAAPRGTERRAPPVRTRSDRHGAFQATRLAPGKLAFGVRRHGHGPRSGELVLRAGEAKHVDVQLPAPCTLSGQVSDERGDAASATLVVGREPFTAVRATTDGSGAFVLHDLAPGSTVAVANGGGERRAEATLELQSGDANHWHPVLATKRDDANLRGVLVDASDAPLAGWRIRSRSVSGLSPPATTSADGTFAMAAPADAAIDLRAYAPNRPLTGFADNVWRSIDPRSLDPRSGVLRLQCAPTAYGRIDGRVETAAHQGVPAAIACWHHERAEHVRFTAAADGTIAWRDVPPGTLDLLCEHPGCASTPRRDLALDPNGRLDLGTIVLAGGGGLSGNVRGPDGLPPSDCQLTMFVGENGRYYADYAAGAYRFPSLPTGEHRLLVQGQGLAAATFPVRIDANTEHQRDVDLRAGVPRKFRVVIPKGAPTACALAIRPPQQNMQWMATAGVQRGPSAAESEVEFVAFMAPGTYEAVAWAGRGWEVRVPVVFVAGDDSELRLELRRK
jgi:hypothetical protein